LTVGGGAAGLWHASQGGGDRLLNMLLQGGFEFLSLLWGCHGVAWLGGLDHKTTGGMRTVIPLQQKQRENCVCGRYRVLRVQCCFSLFFV
jgi:hypothetical protein